LRSKRGVFFCGEVKCGSRFVSLSRCRFRLFWEVQARERYRVTMVFITSVKEIFDKDETKVRKYDINSRTLTWILQYQMERVLMGWM